MMKPFLETQNLRILQAELADLDNWCIVSPDNPKKTEELLHRSIDEFERFGFGMGSIIEKTSGEFVGRAGLYFYFDPDIKQDLELACFIARHHRNKGYGTELTIGMIDWGFEHLNIDRLTGLTPVDLANAHFVLERSGMKRIESLRIEGEDLFLYEVTRDDWCDRKGLPASKSHRKTLSKRINPLLASPLL